MILLCPHEQFINSQEEFRIQFYLKIIDTTLSSNQERFESLKQYNNVFCIYLWIWRHNTEEGIQKSCSDLHDFLQIINETSFKLIEQ